MLKERQASGENEVVPAASEVVLKFGVTDAGWAAGVAREFFPTQAGGGVGGAVIFLARRQESRALIWAYRGRDRALIWCLAFGEMQIPIRK